MKRRTKISIIAITCFGVLSPVSAFADNPLEKLIPRGTLFKKLKKEIVDEFGGDKAKTPTPTPRRAPTPAQRPANRKVQTPTQARTPQQRQSAQPNVATRRLPPMKNRAQATSNRDTAAARRPIQPAAISASKGFGVVVQMSKNNDMVVTRVHPQGNAVKAGLRPGDIVKTVGSVKLTSLEEYDQITKGLGAGDQMEFEVVRRGRPEKALVQFGTIPKASEITTTAGSAAVNVSDQQTKYSPAELSGVPSVLDSSSQPAARVSSLPQGAPSVVAVQSTNEAHLHRKIESQRAKMERMELELEMLRRTNTPAIAPTENNWALPELGSPN